MMKNVKLKKILKGTVCKPLSLLNKCLPKSDKVVLLYISSMGIRHNLKPLLKYLIDNDYCKKYRVYCGIESMKYKDEEIPDVKFIGKVMSHIVFLFAKHVFYTAGQIPIKPGKNQCVIHLTHGAVYYKTMGALSNINNGDEFFFSKMLVTGERFKSIVKQAYGCGDENLLLCNEPMTDIFFRDRTEERKVESEEKTIFWLPTFRQSDTIGYNNSDNTKTLLIFDYEDYKTLNAFLRERNIRIIVKLHAAQSLKNVHAGSYSHLAIYSHDEFQQNCYDIYELMCQSDALIGDYSSASLQYLLLNKPMAYVIPDLDDYKKQRGFVFDDPIKYMPGNIIVDQKGFYQFIDEIYRGIDTHKIEREKVCNEIHLYQDGDACKRVVEASGMYI